MWNGMPHHIVFEKVSVFEKRLTIIVRIFQLIQEFSRLSRVELSAMGGRSLTVQVQNICTQVKSGHTIVGFIHLRSNRCTTSSNSFVTLKLQS